MHTQEARVRTTGQATDITPLIREFCARLGDGLLNVFAPHSTVGLALAQIGDGSGDDILAAFQRLLPRDIEYAHREKASGHGADHVVPVLACPSLTIPVIAGAPLLGQFQQVVFLDFDIQPTERHVTLSFLTASG